MSSRPSLHVVPRDPGLPSPSISVPELSHSLAQNWDRWHPVDPAPDHDPWTIEKDTDQQIRELAWQTLEMLWDETTPATTGTGEVVDFDMFPSPIRGYRLRLLTPVD